MCFPAAPFLLVSLKFELYGSTASQAEVVDIEPSLPAGYPGGG
jgi:hypothetical protein